MIKKNKIWQIIWIVGIYLILIVILFLVVQYKIKFEDRDFSKYLYFYECSNNLCTTNIKQEKYINKIKCEKETCPYIKEIRDKVVILKFDSTEKIYNYETNKIINDNYKEYNFIDDEYLICKNENNRYGIINIQEGLINEPEFDKILSYNEGYIAYKKDNKYAIKNIYNQEEINTNLIYDDITFIDNNIFGAKKDDVYRIYNYNEEPVKDEFYNYLFSKKGYIFIFKDNKLDILNSDLESKLLMKIKTYYDYTTQEQISSLNIKVEEGMISFMINNSNTSHTKYYFDTEKGIIVS